MSGNIITKKKNTNNDKKGEPKRKNSKAKTKKTKKKVISKILTHAGYALVKEHFGFRAINRCKKDLNVKPYVPPDFGTPDSYPVYLENTRKIYLPRHYGIEHFGEPDQVKIGNAMDIDVEFKGTLRNEPGKDKDQVAPVKAFLDSCEPGTYSSQSYGGIICVPPASGKTVMALYIISKIKKKTIIVAHVDFLLTQWRDRIKMFLPDARVGILQQNKIQVKNKDIVVASLKSLAMKNYPPEIFKEFGLCIIDECHLSSTELYSKAYPKLGCKYTMGLSATPKRKDGLSKVFKWHLGPILYNISKRTQDTGSVVECIQFNSTNTDYTKLETSHYGKILMSRMINNICAYRKRTLFIVELIRESIKEGRVIILLSERRGHLEEFYNEVVERDICPVGYYVGGMKERDLKESETKQLILATYQMASVGLDIPTLNTIIFASPRSEVTQAFGRILRKINKELPPKGYDIIDNSIQVYSRQFNNRRRIYKRNKFKYNMSKVYDYEDTTVEELMTQYEDNTPKERKPPKLLEAKLNGKCLLEDSDED
jgi:superfamily II DNA or RNA helicase